MTPEPFDVVIAGAGIVGSACACRLAEAGQRVAIIDPGPIGSAGATAAGMGHIMVSDDAPAQLALTRLSRQLWDQLAPRLPRDCERVVCGTLWIAEDEEEWRLAHVKAERLGAHGIGAELLDARALEQAEPNLRPGLAGGLRLPEDSILYPPCVVRWMLQRVVDLGGDVIIGPRVNTMRDRVAALSDGRHFEAAHLINATGVWAPELAAGFDRESAELPVRRRKGHLLITERAPGFCTHEIIELGYLKAAHGHGDESVAFNIQMRATGQLLLGSTRQYGRDTPEVEPRMIARLVRRGVHFMPALAGLNVLRTWTGFRAATPDSLPLIGPCADDPSVVLATGHEGLGVTTAMGTAELIAAHVLGTVPPIAPEPYRPTPARCGASERLRA